MKNQKISKSILNRRHFLGQASCAAVTATPMLSTLLNLKLVNNSSAATSSDDYKALVCIFLAGGIDSHNTLVPSDPESYAAYTRARSDLALAKESLLPLNGSLGGKTYGLHATMKEVQSMYNAGELSFVANVGTLVEPTDLRGFENGSSKLPLGLFSHSDQIMHWQTSVPDARAPYGWAGRVADLIDDTYNKSDVSMNISLSGSNFFQAGERTVSYEVSPNGNGSIQLNGFGSDPAIQALSKTAVKNLMDLEYKNVFKSTFAKKNKESIEVSDQFANAIAGSSVSTAFSPTQLSQSLKMISRTIKSHQKLGMKRQTFFVLYGGWDHHEELINNQNTMLPIVSQAMGEFNQSMKEIGMSKNVTTFTSSDFARTLSSNGRGSDHGWGGNHMVMGGAVKGGRIFGDYPNLAPGNPLDTGRGRLIPTLSTDEYFAELALWFGVSKADLPQIFPNLSRFYSLNSNQNPIGLFQS